MFHIVLFTLIQAPALASKTTNPAGIVSVNPSDLAGRSTINIKFLKENADRDFRNFLNRILYFTNMDFDSIQEIKLENFECKFNPNNNLQFYCSQKRESQFQIVGSKGPTTVSVNPQAIFSEILVRSLEIHEFVPAPNKTSDEGKEIVSSEVIITFKKGSDSVDIATDKDSFVLITKGQ